MARRTLEIESPPRNEGRAVSAAAWLALLACCVVTWLAGCSSRTESQPQGPVASSAPDRLPPLEHPPLDPPLRITATFGEFRHGHFHAGDDFSTDHHIGKPVYAPASGEVERVQTSGSGFGNNLMIRTPDGRSILLAHLDAFDEPIASFVAAAQESSARYEQTLTPGAGRMPIRAGQRVAWSGESGAGPPHLHMEIRVGDLAYNPLEFGLSIPDSTAPVLRRVTFEPLDDTSSVQGSPAPRTVSLLGGSDSVVVRGRVRVWLEAKDGVSDRGPRDAPYSQSLEWNGEQVECRFDRVAWDDQMPAAEWVYDGQGRVAFGTPVGLWFDSDYRPTMFRASSTAPSAGTVEVKAGDPPRVLTLRAADAAGNASEKKLVLRPPRDGESFGAGPLRRRRRAATGARFELMPVDGPFVRIRYSGAPAAAGEVMVGLEGRAPALRPASFEAGRWVAVVRVPLGASAFVASGRGASGPWEDRVQAHLVAVSPAQAAELSAASGGATFKLTLPERGVFVSTFLVVDSLATPGATSALAPQSPAFEVEPSELPLLHPASVELSARPGGAKGELFHLHGGGWAAVASPSGESEGAGNEPTGRIRSLGRFALFADLAPPRIGPARVMRIPTQAPNRWALRCGVIERGSGLDLEKTRFEIDGRPVPSEWDPEHATLRWRPLHLPAAGTHAYTVIAVDRAGHETRATGRFVAR